MALIPEATIASKPFFHYMRILLSERFPFKKIAGKIREITDVDRRKKSMPMNITKAQIIDYIRSGIKVKEIDVLLKQLCVYIEHFKYENR